jgi:SAM-dependent methyltransferase
MFVPNSEGQASDIAQLTVQAVNQTLPFLAQLAEQFHAPVMARATSVEFGKGTDSTALAMLFNRYGSDKATLHAYHHVYAKLLNPTTATAVLEIGLGTNYTDVVSTMGVAGKPGASLRAFRDYLPLASIYGADIDRRVLFAEDRINTFFVDQTAPATLGELDAHIGEDFDLIVDDGLHSPNANIATLNFALSRLKPGGWFVVEDARPSTACVWQVVTALLPSVYSAYLIDDGHTVLYAVQFANIVK